MLVGMVVLVYLHKKCWLLLVKMLLPWLLYHLFVEKLGP